MVVSDDAVFDDLVAEQDRLDAILGGLDEADWAVPSAAAGWTVADVVLHLAQTEEAVTASAAGTDLAARYTRWRHRRRGDGPAASGGAASASAAVLPRWRTARLAAVAALRAADPDRPRHGRRRR